MSLKNLKIGFFVPTFNAGETTRGIEIAKALRELAATRKREVDIRFFSVYQNVRNFEAQIHAAGFPVEHRDIGISQADIAAFMNADHQAKEFVSSPERARAYLEASLSRLRDFRPDQVVHGFIPPIGMAAQITGTPSVSFLPFPPSRVWARKHLLKDLPDPLENRFTLRLPKAIRRLLVRLVATQLDKQPFFAQPTLAAAGRQCGWRNEESNLFGMLAATVSMVADLPDFYAGQDLGSSSKLTGPLFSQPVEEPVPQPVAQIMDPNRPNRIFVSMGSSGEAHYLIEAVRAVADPAFHAVVLVPPSICFLKELKAATGPLPDTIFLSDTFMPAARICAMAEAALVHGGQGTMQTAIHAGVPVVGVAMQAEQQTNPDNLARQGAGIRIAKRFWTAPTIRNALRSVLNRPDFRNNAGRLQRSFRAINGRMEAAKTILDLCEKKGL